MKLRPWLVMTLIFLLGAGTGSLLTLGLGPGFLKPPGARDVRNRWMTHLVHRLQLTPDQQAKIQPILTEAEGRIQAVHRDDVQRISGIFHETDERIIPLLGPTQVTELKELEQEHAHAFPGPMHGPPPGR